MVCILQFEDVKAAVLFVLDLPSLPSTLLSLSMSHLIRLESKSRAMAEIDEVINGSLSFSLSRLFSL